MTAHQATTHADAELPTLLDIADLAQHLHVDIRHIRRLVAERRIPYIKWGHLLRFDPTEIQDWINNCRHHPRRPMGADRAAHVIRS